MTQTSDFIRMIAHYLAHPEQPLDQLFDLVRDVLRMPDPSDRSALEKIQKRIDTTPGATGQVALVYGGATKIKGYVFEAPKLPEIRGASALLDWVNETAIRQIWHDKLDQIMGDSTIVDESLIYASGGSFLGFAPRIMGADLASAVEHCYTEQTLTANSAAVSANFSLLELRFGRNPTGYWIEDFLRDCQHQQRREALFAYYYPPETIKDYDLSDVALRIRFFNRKSFGELVTILVTMFNRRRDEQSSYGPPRDLTRYELLPWGVKCQSSDVRPAAIKTQVGTDIRTLSEPSARKLAAGRAVKGKTIGKDLGQSLKPWEVPESLRSESWHQRWEHFLRTEQGQQTYYAQQIASLRDRGDQRLIEPADDLYQIGAASSTTRYIGLIYADGNNIGRLMATLSSPLIYQLVSQALSDVAKKAVFNGLANHLAPVEVLDRDEQLRGLKHPFEILAIGGDDFFIIVPGDRAFEVSLTIAQTFERELSSRFKQIAQEHKDFNLPKPSVLAGRSRYAHTNDDLPLVGLSAGVLIAQENAPFFFLRDLVEELLKKAKKLAKQHAAPLDSYKQPQPRFYGGAVDFMVLKSTTMVSDDITSFRKVALNDHKQSKRRLTARPYTWSEFAGLLTSVQALKDAHMPRSQLYRLRRALDADSGQGVLSSTMEYLYTRSRQNKAVATTLLQHIEHAWCLGTISSAGRVGMPPWLPWGDAGYETIWSDLLEAYDFVTTRAPDEASD